MPDFTYTAVAKDGRSKKGTITAENKSRVIDMLKTNGLLPMSVEEQSMFNKDINIDFLNSKPKPRDLSVFCRQFVSIVNAGVSIISALDMLSTQTENKTLKKAVLDTKNGVETGDTLAGAMSKNKKVFSEMFITLVEAGEASGSIETSFDRMASQFEKSAKLKGLIKKATIYPIAVGVVAVAVVIVMLTFVIPTFQDMFDDMGTELPGLTKAVVAASEFVQTKWFILVAIIAAAVVGIKMFKKTEPGKLIFGKIGLKAPLFGNLTQKSAASRFARTLSTLTAAGIPLIDALEITSGTMTNIYFKNALLEAKNEVSLGTPLSEPLERGKLFPPLVCHMIKIGEESGDLESMLDKLADYYDEEVEMATQALMAALEPAIIVVLALVIGTIIMAIMMPMASMYENLDSI